MPDIAVELWGVQHLAQLTRMNIANIQDAKSVLGPKEHGIDVVFDFNGQGFGAQHTVFHFDEGQTGDKPGSQVRAKEEATARATQTASGMWANPDYRPALGLRIKEKIAIAARHDNRHLVSEAWLVVSANLNKWGTVGSTMIVPSALRIEDLNSLYHSHLTTSNFGRTYLVLHMSSIVYGWNRAEGWRLVADPDAREREQHRRQMNDLVFNQIPRHHRGG